MLKSRFLLLVLVACSTLIWLAPAAEAGWLFGRRGSSRSNYSTRTRYYSPRATRSSRSSSLHMTHSRSAIMNGFFGPGPGVQGVDSSWYIGR